MARPSRKRAASRALPRALVRLEPETEEASPAEQQLRAVLDRLTELEAATRSLSSEIRRFRDERKSRLGAAEEELFAARRLEERIARLSSEAEEWARSGPPKPEGTRRRPRARAPLPAITVIGPSAEAWISSKDLYRLLARKLHPDLASTDGERARRSELMARVNAAYAADDRVLLELLHGEADTHDVRGETHDPSPSIRAGHAERRLATLAPLVTSLERELTRQRASSAFKELESARRAAEAGDDPFARELEQLCVRTRTSAERAFEEASKLGASLNALRRTSRERSSAPGGLARRAVLRPDKQRVGAQAARLAEDLRRRAAREPWTVALAAFAFFGEVSAEPAPGLRTLADAQERYEHLRAAWPAAPPFGHALLALPAFLEVGMRAYPRRLGFGIQLKQGELVAGVRALLVSPEALPVARRVLEALGPLERCTRCNRTTYLVHLFRTRGIDEVHALVCPECAAVARSYRSLGMPEGIEALAPYSVSVGSVVVMKVRIAAATVVLEFLPRERQKLTARDLVRRLDDLYLAAVSKGEDDDIASQVRVRQGKSLLAPSAPVRAAEVRIVLARGAPLSAKELALRLRRRA